MAFEITRDHAYRRSHELRWRCPCGDWGRVNANRREDAIRIFEICRDVHGPECARNDQGGEQR